MRSVFFYRPWQPPSRETGWRWWLSVWTPVAVAVAVIFIESTSAFSAQHTSSWLRPIVEQWFGVINDATWESFHHYLRKSGHFVGYGTAGFTFLRAWLHTLDRRGPTGLLAWRLESTILAIFSTAILASCDEAHQAMLPDRTGTPMDVLLDTAGACALCLSIWVLCWAKRSPERAG